MKPLDYEYTHIGPGWDFSYVEPPIWDALEAIPKDGEILDIGCGNGAMLAEIEKRGSWRLFGLESSPSGVEMSRRQGFDVRLGDANTEMVDCFPGQSFHLIISVEVVEHVYDPRGFLRQAWALLRPNGRLVLTTPYHGYLKNLLVALAGKGDAHYNPLWDCGHIKFWSRKTLTFALEEAGFRKIRFFGAGRMPYLWKSMVLTATKVTS